MMMIIIVIKFETKGVKWKMPIAKVYQPSDWSPNHCDYNKDNDNDNIDNDNAHDYYKDNDDNDNNDDSDYTDKDDYVHVDDDDDDDDEKNLNQEQIYYRNGIPVVVVVIRFDEYW